MSLLDDLRKLADVLAPELKPVEDELPHIVGALVHSLEAKLGLEAAPPPAPVATPAEEDPTHGSAVYDVAGAAGDPGPAPAAGEDVKALQDQIQSLQVKLADLQKTQHQAVE